MKHKCISVAFLDDERFAAGAAGSVASIAGADAIGASGAGAAGASKVTGFGPAGAAGAGVAGCTGETVAAPESGVDGSLSKPDQEMFPSRFFVGKKLDFC